MMVAVSLLVFLFLFGAAWASAKLLPILNGIGAVTLALLIVIALPLSFVKRCRAACAISFVYWSYFTGVCLWMTSLLLTITLWGYFAVIIGLLMGGVGVLPIAILACLFKGEWLILFALLFQLIQVIGARIYGVYLVKKVDDEQRLEEKGILIKTFQTAPPQNQNSN